MSLCPCGSKDTYERCCGIFLDKGQQPQTPEQLMRSRYTAYSLGNIDYIKKTMKAEALIGFNEFEAKQWAERVSWISLEVIQSSMSSPNQGFVEFAARFLDQQQVQIIHEVSEFQRENDSWYYVKGVPPEKKKNPKTPVARNAPCPCGSARKFKNCHAK